jgi:hypothetical protein
MGSPQKELNKKNPPEEKASRKREWESVLIL